MKLLNIYSVNKQRVGIFTGVYNYSWHGNTPKAMNKRNALINKYQLDSLMIGHINEEGGHYFNKDGSSAEFMPIAELLNNFRLYGKTDHKKLCQKYKIECSINNFELEIVEGGMKGYIISSENNKNFIFFVNENQGLNPLWMKDISEAFSCNVVYVLNDVTFETVHPFLHKADAHLLVYEKGVGYSTACGSAAQAVCRALSRSSGRVQRDNRVYQISFKYTQRIEDTLHIAERTPTYIAKVCPHKNYRDDMRILLYLAENFSEIPQVEYPIGVWSTIKYLISKVI